MKSSQKYRCSRVHSSHYDLDVLAESTNPPNFEKRRRLNEQLVPFVPNFSSFLLSLLSFYTLRTSGLKSGLQPSNDVKNVKQFWVRPRPFRICNCKIELLFIVPVQIQDGISYFAVRTKDHFRSLMASWFSKFEQNIVLSLGFSVLLVSRSKIRFGVWTLTTMLVKIRHQLGQLSKSRLQPVGVIDQPADSTQPASFE